VSRLLFIPLALICVSPGILLWDGLIVQGSICGIVAFGLAIASVVMRPAEARFCLGAILPVAIAAIIPALWILLQALPVNVAPHPIWTNVEAALGYKVARSISVDPGASIIALARYLAFVGFGFLTAAVAVERQRAQTLFFALIVAGVCTILIVVVRDLLPSTIEFSTFAGAEAADCLAITAIVIAAACVRVVERHETHQAATRSWMFIATSVCCVAVAITVGLSALEGGREVAVATACGLAVFVYVVIMRRIQLGPKWILAFAVPVIGIAVLLLHAHQTESSRNLLLTYAKQSAASSIDVTERALGDAPLVGTGAGTFTGMAEIYREMDDPPIPSPPNMAAGFAIELGRPMLWLIALMTAILTLMLLKASLQRGRDSFYSAMGGSCLVTLFLLAFINGSLSGNAAALLISAILGVSIAQRKGRTSRT
jgi:hypothetical protein